MPMSTDHFGNDHVEPNLHARNPHVICGDCNQPANVHPVVIPEVSLYCLREAYEVGDRNYDLPDEGHRTNVDTDEYGLPLEDYSGMGAASNDSFDAWAIVPDPTALSDLAGDYNDLRPDERTYATSWSYVNPTTGVSLSGDYALDHPNRSTASLPTNVEPRNRNAYVEGNDGFSTVTVWDEGLTAKYHARLLNVFRDRDSSLRIGSIKIAYYPDGSVRGTCVKCRQALTCTPGADLDRELLEDFVIAVIRHGNNHAAKWFTERDTFYKVHTSDCSLNCDAKSPHCVPVLTHQ